MCLTIACALAMFGWLQYCNYYRTHVYIQVVDQVSGKALSRFEYRVRIITSESKPDDWYSGDLSDISDWTNYLGVGPLVLAIPECCRLALGVRSLDLDGGYEETRHEELFLPELSHTLTIRMQQGMEVEGIVFDAEKKTPIQGAAISSGDFQDEFAVRTDSEGRFLLRNVRPSQDILAVHREYQIGVVSTHGLNLGEASSIALTRARRIESRVCCSSTGEPIAGCAISQPWTPKPKGFCGCGCFSSFPSFPERRETTDQMGRFVFYFDDAGDSTLLISKQGWSEKRIDLKKENLSLDPILLDLVPCLLRGSVVNGRGDPVTEFVLQAEVNDSRFYHGKETQHVTDAQGKFEFRSQMSLDAFSIRSKSDGVYYHRRSRSNEHGIPEDLLHLQIKLEDGFGLKGRVVGDSEAINLTEVILVRGYIEPHSELLVTSQDNQSSWKVPVNTHGYFHFEQLTVGEYTLVTLCNGTLVNKRPVTIRDQDVSVQNIVLPQLLNVAGTVQLADGTDARICSFDLEFDGHKTHFRTDFRGRFALTKFPAGTYELKSRYSEFSCDDSKSVASVTFSKNCDCFASFREFPIIAIDSGTLPTSDYFKFDYTQFAHPKHRALRQAEEDPRLLLGTKVSGGIDARLTFDVRGGDQQLNVKVDVDSRSGPKQVFFRTRELVIDYAVGTVGMKNINDLHKRANFLEVLQQVEMDPFVNGDDEQATTAKAGLSELTSNWNDGDHRTNMFFIRNGELLSKVTTRELVETLSVLLPEHNPDTCIIQNPQLGWAKVNAPEITSDQITLLDVRFQSGVMVNVECSLDCLPIFPNELRLSHSEGVVISTKFEFYHSKETFEFPHSYPGQWAAELVGIDPYLGEVILGRTEFLVDDSIAIAIKLGSFGIYHELGPDKVRATQIANDADK